MPHGSPRIRLFDNSMNLVGTRVRERRQQLHVTQDQLCGRVADVTEGAWVPSRHDVYRVEAGTRTVSDAEVVALAAALSCGLVWLICGVPDEPLMAEMAARIFHDALPAIEPGGASSQGLPPHGSDRP